MSLTRRDLRDHLFQPSPFPDKETKHFPLRKWLAQLGLLSQPHMVGKGTRMQHPCFPVQGSFPLPTLGSQNRFPVQPCTTFHLPTSLLNKASVVIPAPGRGVRIAGKVENSHSAQSGWSSFGSQHTGDSYLPYSTDQNIWGKPGLRKSRVIGTTSIVQTLRTNEKGITYSLVSMSLSPCYLLSPRFSKDHSSQGCCED